MRAHVPQALRWFARVHPEAEGVIQHVGLATWDLLVVDVDGTWVRGEFSSRELAEAACRDLGIRSNLGWDDPRLARRMNRRDHWDRPGGQRRAI
ncbi:MAG TPA: hypothetical protein VF984_08235 [Actinomycetota bacterium]